MESKDNNIPLAIACRHENKEGLDNNTPLIHACYRGNKKFVEWFIDHGADVNKESENYSPLGAAKKIGNEIITKYLIQHGATVNKLNNYEMDNKKLCRELDWSTFTYLKW